MRRKSTPPGRAAAEGAKQTKTGNTRLIPQISGSAKIGRSLAAQAKEARRTAAHIGAYTGEAFRPFEPKPVPGRMRPDGTWVRVPLSERRMTRAEAVEANRTGAHVGLLAAWFPALHIDVGMPLLVAEIETLALGILGPAPVRTRPDMSSVLLMYRGKGHRPRRVAFAFPHPSPYAVEWLGAGEIYVVEGWAPNGAPYQWRGIHPADTGAAGLSVVTAEMADTFFASLLPLLERHGVPRASLRWGV